MSMARMMLIYLCINNINTVRYLPAFINKYVFKNDIGGINLDILCVQIKATIRKRELKGDVPLNGVHAKE